MGVLIDTWPESAIRMAIGIGPRKYTVSSLPALPGKWTDIYFIQFVFCNTYFIIVSPVTSNSNTGDVA